jgi:hypothetical protein
MMKKTSKFKKLELFIFIMYQRYSLQAEKFSYSLVTILSTYTATYWKLLSVLIQRSSIEIVSLLLKQWNYELSHRKKLGTFEPLFFFFFFSVVVLFWLVHSKLSDSFKDVNHLITESCVKNTFVFMFLTLIKSFG